MLRIAHISDTHLGYRQYGSDVRKQDYMDAFVECVDKSIEYSVDAIIHTGDLFDDPNPDIETLNKTISAIQKLEDNDIPFYGIVGNHERKRTEQWMDLIGQLSNIHRLDTTPTVVSNESESAVLYGFDAIRKNQWSTTDFSLQPPEDTEFQDSPKIVGLHQLFYPPLDELVSEYALEPIVQEMTLTPDLIALGDNHTPEESKLDFTENNCTAYYPGSTEKTSVSDPNTHSFTAIGIEDGEIKSRSQVELSSPRPFITTEISFTEDNSGFETVRNEINQTNYTTSTKEPVAVIRLTGINTGVTHNEIRELLAEKSVALVRIIDKRRSMEFEEEEPELADTTDLETAIDDAVGTVNMDNSVEKIEAIVRDTDEVAKTNIRDEINSVVTNTSDTQ